LCGVRPLSPFEGGAKMHQPKTAQPVAGAYPSRDADQVPPVWANRLERRLCMPQVFVPASKRPLPAKLGGHPDRVPAVRESDLLGGHRLPVLRRSPARHPPRADVRGRGGNAGAGRGGDGSRCHAASREPPGSRRQLGRARVRPNRTRGPRPGDSEPLTQRAGAGAREGSRHGSSSDGAVAGAGIRERQSPIHRESRAQGSGTFSTARHGGPEGGSVGQSVRQCPSESHRNRNHCAGLEARAAHRSKWRAHRMVAGLCGRTARRICRKRPLESPAPGALGLSERRA